MTRAVASPRGQGTQVSVVVPVRDGARTLGRCLEALRQSRDIVFEVIVVDDGSTDDSARVATLSGSRVVTLSVGEGPAAARNRGAALAASPVVCFVDADVVVRPTTLASVVRHWEADSGLGGVFGSYDAQPEDRGVVSQFRNLLHHYTHQKANANSGSFWAGCGALRREVFEAVGGFDATRFPRPSIEDIDLGVRLAAAGHRVRLDASIQVTHLKAWSLRSMIATDMARRAWPWASLVLTGARLPNDLNLSTASRVSALLVALSMVSSGLAVAAAWLMPGAAVGASRPWGAGLSAVALGALAAALWINRGFYRCVLRARGPWYALASMPLHLLYFAYSGLTFVACWAWMSLRSLRGRRR